MEFQYWKSNKNGQWYWHLVSANNKIIADGAEGYQNKADCLRGIDLVRGSYSAPAREYVDS